ncbi:unnamed protein product [Adineta steineri]|uniref:Uncharacterized protein n=1 Tax=Adineta steineri TaxID=433720 RepID=A0A820EPF9_9BILA|nr:unnamed protein product [Adineta steineri]CAF4251945.1 unnamed protein product [Adineta steineri]
MLVITLIISFFVSLLITSTSTDQNCECINTNNQTYVPYQLPTGQSPVSNQVPNGAQLYPLYTTCHLIPYNYAYNPSIDCLSTTNNRVIDPIIPLFLSPSMFKTAALLEKFIQKHYDNSPTPSITNFTVLINRTLTTIVDSIDVIAELHLSLDYFSCYTAQEQTGIEIGFSKYKWSSFNITFYHNITCTIDIKQGYIELFVDDQSQLTLQTFVRGLEQSVTQNGNVTIKYPRNFGEDRFHATLLTADYRFPYDCMTEKLEDYMTNTQNQPLLGLPITIEVCCFITQDTITRQIKYYRATTCTNPLNPCILDQ